ncbi:class F sortase [Saccharopolyspora gloriosae]|uniref:class F sortase n=1 Tax=Saccharopolyspora gloriosae TaxID=455344 RepID=UPI001FB66230|nr:class F sortase [Saccharopolyspora gloriosae]
MNARFRVWGGRGTVAASPLAAVAAVLALSGCSAAGQEIDLAPQPPAVTSASPAGEQLPKLPESTPDWLDVPDIDAHSTLLPLGLNDDRTVAVPSVHEPMQAGWYRYGPTPGETGPAVILGHVNGDGQDGIFARLHQLGSGDEIRVGREDGTVARFTVTRMDQVPKDRFPTDEVYGDTTEPELRLITCGGAFDDAAGSYRDNIIAYATFTGVVP